MTRRRLLLLGLLGCFVTAAAAQDLRLRIADITSPFVALHGVDARLALAGTQPLTVRIARVSFRDRVWRDVELRCARTRIASDLVECRQGVVRLDTPIPLDFSYRPRSRDLHLVLLPAPGERWELRLRSHGQQSSAQLHVENGSLARLNPLLGGPMPPLSAGHLMLDASWSSDSRERGSLDMTGKLAAVAFSDKSGLHAGDNLGGEFTLRGTLGPDKRWLWRADGAWTSGEVFWQPFYLGPSRRVLAASGELDAQSLVVRDGRLDLDRIGMIRFDGTWARRPQRLEALNAEAAALNLAGLYDGFLKPIWVDRMPGQLVVAGDASARLEVRAGKPAAFDLDVRDAAVRHENGLLELSGVSLHLPWRADAPSAARANIGGGRLWGLPLGPFSVAAELEPGAVRVNHLAVPVLDGRLIVDHLALSRSGTGDAAEWRGEASAALQPVSMERLSAALKWPPMRGTLSGVIPHASYARQTLTVDGALLFRVFDGTAVVKDVRVSDPLSRASHAYASIDMRGLDLDLLTRAFSFGSMAGRVDVSVQGLELANWRPVRFDARVASSRGDYPRRISQRAVENIASLGGASAAAALQRSFLRFFGEFGYDRIGLSCRLERNVCAMGGIGEAGNGYLIVKGGGIPALSVIGYNRYVGWNELLARLSRIRQTGVKPVIQ